MYWTQLVDMFWSASLESLFFHLWGVSNVFQQSLKVLIVLEVHLETGILFGIRWLIVEIKEYLLEITEIQKLQGMLAGWLNWSDVKSQFVFVKDSKIKIRWFFMSISVP